MKLKRNIYCGQINEDLIDKEVILSGWISKSRNLGSIIFADLRDRTGIAQIVFDEDSKYFDLAKKLRQEFVVSVKGKIRKRSSINEDLKTGRVEVLVDDLEILSESEIPPIYVKDDDNASENMRLKYRTLDLRKPSLQNNLITRSKIYKVTRDFFYNEGFIEIETPMLTKPTPEGARDYLVPSRVKPGHFYALPQSPQLMKQLLMVSGFDRYIQITKCFRDEDLRANRQPEFTQIDLEMSFVDIDDVLSINERYIKTLFKEMLDIDIELPLMRMTYKEAMNKYGLDKPDLRFDMHINDLSDLVRDCGFKIFENSCSDGFSVRGIKADGANEFYSSKGLKKLENFTKDYKAKGLVWIRVDEDIKSSIDKFVDKSLIEKICESFDAKKGDLILIIAGSDNIVLDSLGNLRNKIAKDMNLYDKGDYKLLWITDFPLFEYSEEEDRYVAKHHPFTSPVDEDLDNLEDNKINARAKAYDMVINGDEVGGGSIRINNSNVQKKMFNALGLKQEEVEEKFGFLLEAFKYGVPPHGGIAYGLDRLTMIFTNASNIRDVIAFPKTQSATCLLTGAPSELDDESLSEVHIKKLK